MKTISKVKSLESEKLRPLQVSVCLSHQIQTDLLHIRAELGLRTWGQLLRLALLHFMLEQLAAGTLSGQQDRVVRCINDLQIDGLQPLTRSGYIR